MSGFGEKLLARGNDDGSDSIEHFDKTKVWNEKNTVNNKIDILNLLETLPPGSNYLHS